MLSGCVPFPPQHNPASFFVAIAPAGMYGDGLMLRRVAGIIIFHLFFILILLKRTHQSERSKLVRAVFLWRLGMFLRGVLEVGAGGPEEKSS